MSKSKNHNSLIFITTLGVYLGLVLVGGAAPQVFAHSALTRNFEISEEIEVKDDLDKNPDGQTSTLSDSIKTYLEDVQVFLIELENLRREGKFDIARDTFEVAQTNQLPCQTGNKIGTYTPDFFASKNDALRPVLDSFGRRLADGYSLGDCLPSPKFNGAEAHQSQFKFKLTDSELSVEVAVRKQSQHVADALIKDLAVSTNRFNPTAKNVVRQRIYENTTFRAENDQIYVITRLPRASLDPLLASNAQ